MNTKTGTILANLAALTGPIALPKAFAALPAWKAKSRDNQPTLRAAPDKNSAHPGALRNGSINIRRAPRRKVSKR